MNWMFLFALMIIWGLVTVYLHSKRQWLLYYLVGAFGLTLFIILAFMNLGYDTKLANIELNHTVFLLQQFGFDGYVQSNQLFIPSPTGWAVLICSIECSALLELSVIFSLIFFYVGFVAKRKVFSAVVGVALTYVANIIRLCIIAGVTYNYGEEYTYLAHSVVSRMVFFVFVLFIYWYIITKPTINIVGKKVVDNAIAREKGGE